MNRKNQSLSVAVIGAGAAGLTAAIGAARAGASVALFEKNDRVGKKILVTGNGRCNLSNRSLEKSRYHGDPEFAMRAVGGFGLEKTLEFFGGLGLRFATEEEGRIFPFSRQAGSVLDALRFETGRLGVETYTAFSIASVKRNGNRFAVASQGGKRFDFDRIVLACGGKADPDLGSDGSGFRLAEGLGHSVTKVFPSLVQLRLEGQSYRAMERMKWEAELRAVTEGKIRGSAKGDILFTSYGISGTGVLSVSRTVMEILEENKAAELEIDLLPGMPENETTAIVRERLARHPERKAEDFFLGWVNKRIGQTLLKSAGLELEKNCGSVTDAEAVRIAALLRHWRFPVAGHNGWKNAQVTAGGVKTDDVNPATMESKIVPGLYFAGEMLDVDGDSGGFNLQWAWSSGMTAGISAAGEGIK